MQIRRTLEIAIRSLIALHQDPANLAQIWHHRQTLALARPMLSLTPSRFAIMIHQIAPAAGPMWISDRPKPSMVANRARQWCAYLAWREACERVISVGIPCQCAILEGLCPSAVVIFYFSSGSLRTSTSSSPSRSCTILFVAG